ncbi:MAG: hypothetical protein M3P96_11735 [Actinomycetota bacterium]|nr:hypothetical protein [Actinomycetota bacterium]
MRPQAVLTPDVPGKRLDAGTTGAFGLALLAGDGDLDEAMDASEAFAGWVGDRFVIVVDAGRRCTTTDVVFDSGNQRARAARALARWDERDRTTIEQRGADALRLVSCT